MKYDYEEIGKIIKNERKKLGLTQDELGKKLYVTGKQISNYEKGKPLPSLETLLKMAELFHCELGYLLGEESYKDRSKLNTAICGSLGLSSKAVESLRTATHKGLTQDFAERQQAISRFFESPHLGGFLDCLVDAASASERLSVYGSSVYQDLVDRYGEEIAAKTILFSSTGGVVPDAQQDDVKLQEAMKTFDASIDKSRDDEYALKVARYELREAFETLVRSIL